MSFKHELELARTWRERQDTDCKRSLGYVVIFNGSVAGWKREMDFPQGWEPGCLAISPEGEVFQAVGGNDYDGAEAWQAAAEEQPEEQLEQMREAIRDLQKRHVFVLEQLSAIHDLYMKVLERERRRSMRVHGGSHVH